MHHAGEQVPAYRDENYNCDMEMLRFYSWAPNPRYDTWIREIGCEIQEIPVISSTLPLIAWMSASSLSAARKSRLAD